MLNIQSAAEFVKLQIKSRFDGDDLRFRLSSCDGPAPHHLAFQYWDHLYFVYVETSEASAPGLVALEEMIALSEAADATPVVVRLAPLNGAWALDEGSLFLRCARTGRVVDPSVVVSNLNWAVRPNLMTPYDLQELAIQVVSAHIEKNGGEIEAKYLGSRPQPSIIFVDKNGKNFVFVDYSLYPDLQPKLRSGIFAPIRRFNLPLKRCFWAPVGIANSKDAFDPSGRIPALQITRRDTCFSKFDSLVPHAEVSLKLRSSYSSADSEMLINYVPEGHLERNSYIGYIDFEDLNPFAQDRLIMQVIELYGRKRAWSYRELSEFGVKKNQLSAVESTISNAISYLQYNGFVANDIDRNFFHQLRRFFANSIFGARLDEIMFELHQYPFSKRTPFPGGLWKSEVDGDDEADRPVEDSPQRFAGRIGLDLKVRPGFPSGSERSFDVEILKGLRWNSQSMSEGLDMLLFALPVIRFPIREHLSPWFKSEALKPAKRHFESPLAYLLSLLVGKATVLITKRKRCAENWFGAYESKGGFADLPKEFPAHDLDDGGYLLMDFVFDSASFLERRKQISPQAAMKVRIETLQSAFGYSTDQFYCASLIRQWEKSPH